MTLAQLSILSLICIALFSSCSSTVYEYKDHLGYSKFTLYDNGKFKYKEKSPSGNFSYWGTYRAKDSIISFNYPDRIRLPYNYQKGSVKKLNKSPSEFATWTFREKVTKEPIKYLTVAFYGKKNNLLTGLESDTNGIVKIYKREGMHEVEITYVNHAPLRFLWEEVDGYNLLIEVAEYDERPMLSCGGSSKMVRIDYRIGREENNTTLEKGSLVYQKRK